VMRAVICHPSAGLEAYGRARDLLTEGDPPLLRARVFAGLAQLTAATDPDEVPALLERAALDVPDGDRELLVDRSSARLLWLIRIGRIDEVEQEAEVGAAVLRDAERPDQAFAGLVSATCALAAARRLPAALRTIERAVELTRAVPVLAVPCLAGRAHVLSRMDRHAEALESARESLAVATRLDSEELIGLARNDAGLVALAAGRHAEAAELLRLALAGSARFSRPASRLARAESLAHAGLADDAAAELRAAALEPVGPGDQPWALVPRMARVQGLIALARGRRTEARRRLGEAAAGWRRIRPPDTGRELMASLVDLGRPPVVGLVDPAWELARVEAELAALPDEEEQCLASS
jgi:tetratricopeptide (TPR) repeat protein